MAISPRFATRTLRIRCDAALFTLRSAVSCQEHLRAHHARVRGSAFDHSRGEKMSRLKLPALPCLLVFVAAATRVFAADADTRPLVIVIHGGAGVIEPSGMTPAKEASYRAGLAAALDAGYGVLERGGSSLDAVTAAVRTLEDDPQFNAGRGAVLNDQGDAELDAAIMDGNGPHAGAVASVLHVKNPVELARLVMEKSRYVLLVGEGAEEFALEQGVALMPRSYFRTEAREREFEETRHLEWAVPNTAPHAASTESHDSMGTVGAVALDRAGNLAAATSTGGLSTNKHRGRVGDSPIIGAGTYANNRSCAVSGTGQGEFFIRGVVAYDVCALVQYRHLELAQAVHEVIHEKLGGAGGEGGVIALDPAGNLAMDFNSVGMFRAARDSRGRREIAMYRNDAKP
jgi:L-asparaginase / beta-aspartyl-peptidase